MDRLGPRAASFVLAMMFLGPVSRGLEAQGPEKDRAGRAMTVDDVLCIERIARVEPAPGGDVSAVVIERARVDGYAPANSYLFDYQRSDIWILPAADGPGGERATAEVAVRNDEPPVREDRRLLRIVRQAGREVPIRLERPAAVVAARDEHYVPIPLGTGAGDGLDRRDVEGAVPRSSAPVDRDRLVVVIRAEREPSEDICPRGPPGGRGSSWPAAKPRRGSAYRSGPS